MEKNHQKKTLQRTLCHLFFKLSFSWWWRINKVCGITVERLVLGTLGSYTTQRSCAFHADSVNSSFLLRPRLCLVCLHQGNTRVSSRFYSRRADVNYASLLSVNTNMQQGVVYICRKSSQKTLPECWELCVAEILYITLSLNPYCIAVFFLQHFH